MFRCRQQNSEPVFRGRKLVLNYTMGSPCDSTSSTYLRKPIDHNDEEGEDPDDHKSKKPRGGAENGRRKSTIISLLCDRDPTAPKVSISFVAQSPDECAYFFEARSAVACGGVSSDTQQSLGPGSVFGVMSVVSPLTYQQVLNG